MSETSDIKQVARLRGLRIPFGRRGVILLSFAVVATGATLNWSWLTAVGAAPLILALVPCAVMCGLGLCMRGKSNSCSNKNDPAQKPDAGGNWTSTKERK